VYTVGVLNVKQLTVHGKLVFMTVSNKSLIYRPQSTALVRYTLRNDTGLPGFMEHNHNVDKISDVSQ
jgi:hypothetical protein